MRAVDHFDFVYLLEGRVLENFPRSRGMRMCVLRWQGKKSGDCVFYIQFFIFSVRYFFCDPRYLGARERKKFWWFKFLVFALLTGDMMFSM